MYKSLYAPSTQVKLGLSRKSKITAHLLVADHGIGERVLARDVEGRTRLAQYMLRAPRQVRQNQRAPPGNGKGIDGSKPTVREWTYHPVPGVA
jgi:hypothetical protein